MLTVYFRQLWEDHRLNFSQEIPGVDSIILPERETKEIWVPDLYFSNGKKEKLTTVTVPVKEFRIYSNGTIFYSQRLVKLYTIYRMDYDIKYVLLTSRL